MKLEAWESRYWQAAQLILERTNSSLEEWLGADQSKAPRELLAHARRALIDAALVRIERAKAQFLKRKKRNARRCSRSRGRRRAMTTEACSG
jgi:hypothetical protein